MNPTDRPTALERMGTAPLLDDDGRAARHAHRVGRQQIRHDLERARIADLQQGLANGYDRCALAKPLQHHAVDGRDDRDRAPSRARRAQPRLRELKFVFGPGDGEAGRSNGLLCTPLCRLRGFQFITGNGTRLQQALESAYRRLRPGEHRRRPGPLGPRLPHRVASRLHCGRELGQRTGIDEGRRRRRQPRDDRFTSYDGIARLQFDPFDPTHYRRRDDEPFAHARLALVVDRHLYRPRATVAVDVGRGITTQRPG